MKCVPDKQQLLTLNAYLVCQARFLCSLQTQPYYPRHARCWRPRDAEPTPRGQAASVPCSRAPSPGYLGPRPWSPSLPHVASQLRPHIRIICGALQTMSALCSPWEVLTQEGWDEIQGSVVWESSLGNPDVQAEKQHVFKSNVVTIVRVRDMETKSGS